MQTADESRAEVFLTLYKQLEGILEKRYAGKDGAANVVAAYLNDADSEPLRADIDLCRRIRNILSHNVEDTGEPVVEPSAGTIGRMEAILEHVKRPVMAINYGTPADKILFAHPNDLALNVMRHMVKNGFSHVPVAVQGKLVGVFSSGSLMLFAARKGLSQVRDELRIGEMKDCIGFGDTRSEKFMFLDKDATLPSVRRAFEMRRERDHRLAVVFLTEDGTVDTPVCALLTSWDVLRDDFAAR
ncbi:MAG: CBS domain-containing protein [Clostridia bacterium]|nr:CBS domain-containing protein [Clostridia bacterium]